jgi:transposase
MAETEEVPAMPRRLTAAPHLPPEELERRYRAARDPVARTHWQIVWLVAVGRACPEVAAIVGYSVDWVRAVLGRYNREGPAGLGDRRHANPGAAPLLTSGQQEELRVALAGPAPDDGLWTCRAVADWIGARVGRTVHEARGWEYLRRLGFSPQRPRPRATAADPAAQEAFKRGAFRRPSRR